MKPQGYILDHNVQDHDTGTASDEQALEEEDRAQL